MKKAYTFDTHRTCSPEETVKQALLKLKKSGVWDTEQVRMYPIGQLDIFDKFVYCVASNVGKRNNWGKWLTKYQAMASALMEFAERYSWYQTIAKVNQTPIKKYAEMGENIVQVTDLVLTNDDKKKAEDISYIQSLDFHWLTGTSLVDGKQRYIPWYEPEFMTSNCLGAGNTLEEATLHAIYETIERHNHNIMMANLDAPRMIDIQTIPHPHILQLIGDMKSLGFEVYLMDCSFYFDVLTIGAIAFHPQYQYVSHYAMNFHLGTHANRDIAIIRALTEVIQNRAATFDNNRSSIQQVGEACLMGENDISSITSHYLRLLRSKNLEIVSYQDLKNTDQDDIDQEIDYIVQDLKTNGYEVIVIDITDEKLQIPCVRVVIPWTQPMLYELFNTAVWGKVRVTPFIKHP